MRISGMSTVGALAIMLSAPTSAALRGDFAGLAICSKLDSMPKGNKLFECNKRTPLRGECRFTLTNNGMAISYLIEDGIVLDKKVVLSADAHFSAPFGLRRGDSYGTAARKIRATTGLSSRHWADGDEEAAGYLQSDDVICGRNKSHTIYVWFKNGRAVSVSASTLPAL